MDDKKLIEEAGKLAKKIMNEYGMISRFDSSKYAGVYMMLCEAIRKTRQECDKEKFDPDEFMNMVVTSEHKEGAERECNRIAEKVKKLISEYPRFDEHFEAKLFKIIGGKK